MARLSGGRHYPRSVGEFQAWFRTGSDCLDYLEWLRWPGGFTCPSCGNAGGWRLGDGRYECAGCHGRTSVTAGTIFDRTRTPLTVWFTACWLFATAKDGISALSLQRSLEIGSCQTAWAMLGRLRSVLVRPGWDQPAATELSERYLHGLGLRSTDIYKLQDVSMEELVRAYSALSPSLTTWRPVVDGTVLPQSPSAAAAAGKLAQFPVIVGSCRYEMDVLAGNPGVNRMASVPANHWERLLQLYQANRADQPDREAELAMLTDLTFRVPGISLAEAQVSSGQPNVYMYLFDFPYHYAADPGFRVTHGSEGAFAFNTTEATEVTRGDLRARQLSAKYTRPGPRSPAGQSVP
jgi:hypothetical protein